MADNFNVFGLPDNEEFDPKKGSNSPSKLSGDKVAGLNKMMDQLMNGLPEETRKMFSDIMDSINIIPITGEDSKEFEKLKKAFSVDINKHMDLLNKLGAIDCDGDCDHCSCNDCNDEDDDKEESWVYPEELDALFSEEFKKIKYISDPEFKEHFQEVFSSPTEKAMITAIASYLTTPIFNKIEKLSLQYCNDQYALLSGIITDEGGETHEVAVVAVETEPKKFMYYIPLYGNNIAFNKETDETEFLDEDVDNEMIEMATKWMGYKDKKAFLITPHEFGSIKPSRQSVHSYGDFLQLGTITSNGSAASNLFIKDANLDESKTTFPIYVKFAEEHSREELQAFSDKFFNVDFNECGYLNTIELKYTRDGKIYFDLDF